MAICPEGKICAACRVTERNTVPARRTVLVIFMTNVVDVCINYLRRKVDSGHDHPLIRTVCGVG
jgi:DNA-binding response OmpR family regulator